MISFAIGHNPTKVIGSDKSLPALQVMIDGFAKEDPPTCKMLPVVSDVPELLVEMGYRKSGTAHTQAVGELSLIAFYYRLRIGEYTVKGKRNNMKQTVQFKLEDVTFYKRTRNGQQHCLPKNASAYLILSANSVTLKFNNQKNRWKGVCVHQETNGDIFFCPIRALGRRVVHLRRQKRQSQASSLPFTTSNQSVMSIVKTLARDSKWQLHSSNTQKHGGYPSNASTRTRYDAAAPTLWLFWAF
jgi:hypothetical protein